MTAVHDISDGGLLVALAEMALASGIGAGIVFGSDAASLPLHALYFGEDQGRYIVTCRRADLDKLQSDAAGAGVPTNHFAVTGGDSLTLPDEAPIVLADLVTAHESWFPTYMAGTSN